VLLDNGVKVGRLTTLHTAVLPVSLLLEHTSGPTPTLMAQTLLTHVHVHGSYLLTGKALAGFAVALIGHGRGRRYDRHEVRILLVVAEKAVELVHFFRILCV